MTQKKEQLAATIGRNTFWGMFASLAQMGTRFVTIPVVVGYLGLGGYGIWNIILTLIMYMRFGSVGSKSAFQKYVAEATGSGDYTKANQLLSTGSAGLLLISLACLIPFCVFSVPLASAVGIPAGLLHPAARAIAVLSVIMVLANWGTVYEAILMGAQRIDLVRNANSFLAVAEAVAIITVLRMGFGLFAMALVMGSSELIFVVYCYFVSRRVIPEIQVGKQYLTRRVVPELVRYAGSYQLLSALQLIYSALLPVAVLRTFGDSDAGIYALGIRLVSPIQMMLYSFVVPILSGGAYLYTSGTNEEMRTLLHKSFKLTFAVCLFPLPFISMFGSLLIYVWTGQVIPSIQPAIRLISVATLFSAFSLLAMVLYRVSGKALLDNIREVLRILALLPIAFFARELGFYGLLAGLAGAELVGMIFMIGALARTFHGFRPMSLFPDARRLLFASMLILGAGVCASYLPVPAVGSERLSAALKLAEIVLACMLAALPALHLTRSITKLEWHTLLNALRLNRDVSPKAVSNS